MILQLFGFIHLSFIDILDILLVGVLIFLFFRWIKGTSAMNIFFAIVLLLAARFLANAMGMNMLSSILGTIMDIGAIALVVIFQPEIRRFFNSLGHSLSQNSYLRKFLPPKMGELSEGSTEELLSACRIMSEQKVGALIVILNENRIKDIVSTGDIVDSKISSRLIQNIFFKNSPLHDGAMIIGSDRIVAARCTLPNTDRRDLPANYGMRHKSAIGITEYCDASVIVVSEQTGTISFVKGGEISPVKNVNDLRALISPETQKTEAE